MSTTPHVISRSVRYHEDASSLFAHLGGTTADDAALLESADITTKNGISSLAVLKGSARITCAGQRVSAQPLTENSHVARIDFVLPFMAKIHGITSLVPIIIS